MGKKAKHKTQIKKKTLNPEFNEVGMDIFFMLSNQFTDHCVGWRRWKTNSPRFGSLLKLLSHSCAREYFGNGFAMAAPHTLKAPCCRLRVIPAGDVGGTSVPGGGNWKFCAGAALGGHLERAHVGARGELGSRVL